MNNEYTNVTLPTVGARLTDTVSVSGQIPLEHETKKALMCSGNAEVTDVKPTDGRIDCSGRLNFCCICTDDRDSLYSFCASADFTHEIPCESSSSDKSAVIFAQVTEIKAEVSGNVLNVNAELELFCRLEEKSVVRMLSASGDTEVHEVFCDYREKELIGHVDKYVREDISAGNIRSVVFTEATAVVRDVSAVVDTARIDGILNLNALCTAKDGEYFPFRQSIPFTVEAETKYDNCKNLSASVSVSDVRLRITEEEYGLATVDAKIHADVYSAADVRVKVLEDAYSPSDPFTCEKRSLQLLLFRDTFEQKAVLKADFPIDNMQEFSEPVFCMLSPQVLSAVKEDAGIRLDGVFITELLYLDKTGELHSSSRALPYSTRISTDCENTEIDAFPTCTAINFGMKKDKGIELNVSLSLVSDIYEIKDTSVVTGTEACQRKTERSGFTVCFADEGETAYSIAKRFCISQKCLHEANPGLEDVMHAGDKAVVIN